jgi:hypothetical protein
MGINMEDTEFDYSRLRGAIKTIFGNEYNFAPEIGMTATSLSLKFNNKAKFRQDEIIKSARLLMIPENEIGIYFFHPKV